MYTKGKNIACVMEPAGEFSMAPRLPRVAGALGTKPQGFVQRHHNRRVSASEMINSIFFKTFTLMSK